MTSIRCDRTPDRESRQRSLGSRAVRSSISDHTRPRLLRFTPGTPEGLLLVRLAHSGRDALVERIATLFATELVDQWHTYLVVATDHKVRVKRLAERFAHRRPSRRPTS